MKIGVEVKIDVKKIEKMRLFKGEKGTYLTMTTFIDTENKDDYGNNGFISHKAEKGEERTPILGNSRVFWIDQEAPPPPEPKGQPGQHANLYNNSAPDDDIPF